MVAGNELCLICQHPAKSLHFQINCCRACASFFRRSIKAKLVYHCQRGTGRCQLTSRSKYKPICRYCRFKKCVEVGMRLDADTEHELTKADSAADVTCDLFNRSPISVNGNKIDYDTKPLLNAIKDNLMKNNTQLIKSIPGVILTPLQKMSYELTKFLSFKAPDPSKVVVSYDVDVKANVRFHEEYLLRLVRLVTTFDEFVSVDNGQKFDIFRHFWATFLFVERIYQSITVFGADENDMRYLLSNTQAIDLGPIYQMPKDDSTEQTKLHKPVVDLTFRHLVGPLKTLRLTHLELTFVTSNLLWSNLTDIRGVTTETFKKAEEILERNAAEMHSYYVYEMKLPNYAARLASISRVIPSAAAVVRAKKELLIVGKFLDVCQVDFFDCELIE